jgi:hypothetical protein
MKCLPSEIVKGLSSPRPPEPRKLLLVQFTFEPVHDDVVDASGIEELQELLAACFHRDQYGTVVLKSPLLMGSLGEDMVLGDRETMPIQFDESRAVIGNVKTAGSGDAAQGPALTPHANHPVASSAAYGGRSPSTAPAE